jgi:hypothetical protein
MIFLIQYSREEGRIVTFKTYHNSKRLQAGEKRLEIELDLNRKKIDHEVVLLEAKSEKALRLTHNRYFSPFISFDGICSLSLVALQQAHLRKIGTGIAIASDHT